MCDVMHFAENMQFLSMCSKELGYHNTEQFWCSFLRIQDQELIIWSRCAVRDEKLIIWGLGTIIWEPWGHFGFHCCPLTPPQPAPLPGERRLAAPVGWLKRHEHLQQESARKVRSLCFFMKGSRWNSLGLARGLGRTPESMDMQRINITPTHTHVQIRVHTFIYLHIQYLSTTASSWTQA